MTRFIQVAALAAAGLWSFAAAAQSSNIYVRVDAGGSFLTGSDFKGFDDSAVIGGGVGYKITPSLRVDATVSYRPSYSGTATDTTTVPGTTLGASAEINSLVGMLNAYYDFKNSSPFTPYVGGGIGFARNEVGSISLTANGARIGSVDGATSTNFAWQVGAGVAYDFSKSIALDVGYHYLDAGTAKSGNTGTVAGVAVSGLQSSGSLTAHEVEVGLRFSF